MKPIFIPYNRIPYKLLMVLIASDLEITPQLLTSGCFSSGKKLFRFFATGYVMYFQERLSSITMPSIFQDL